MVVVWNLLMKIFRWSTASTDNMGLTDMIQLEMLNSL